jgi:hypothetical protein
LALLRCNARIIAQTSLCLQYPGESVGYACSPARVLYNPAFYELRARAPWPAT